MSEAVVELENVWKVFGARSGEAMKAIRSEGIGKSEVLERYDAVVGVKAEGDRVAEKFSMRRGRLAWVLRLPRAPWLTVRARARWPAGSDRLSSHLHVD